jgi:CheY-like chemotaxis protein
VEVSDDGCGMDPETLERAFEPFFTTKPQGQGTGLGLATVHGIAHQNRGFVAVESEPGQGTTIRFYLPRESGQVADDAVPVQAPLVMGSETVLLVEDEPALLKLATRMIERLGFTVLAAESPHEAIRMAAEYPGAIDLLVTDVVMPGMNGAELLRLLGASRPGLRCLFVSGYPARVLAETGVLDDGVELLPKPYSQEALAEKLREVLARG